MRSHTLRELIERKNTILKTIAEQGKLDAALREKILACREKKELEEIYLPYKPKRRTRAAIARERGLEGLAAILKRQVNPGGFARRGAAAVHQSRPRGARRRDGPSRSAATSSPRSGPTTRRFAAWCARRCNRVRSTRRSAATGPASRASSRCITTIASRWPKCLRTVSWPCAAARPKKCCASGIEIDEEPILRRLTGRLVTNPSFLFRHELTETVADCYRRLLFPSLESTLLAEMKEKADEEAIRVFSQNLRELLLFSPAGQRPGAGNRSRASARAARWPWSMPRASSWRTPRSIPRRPTTRPMRRPDPARPDRPARCRADRHRHGHRLARNRRLRRRLLQSTGRKVAKVAVNESGASIYSASETARAEFPDLDLTVRGAISIARRLQDPLAELVKVDAKSIGVGQYQHDVNQAKLRKALDREVESCVNLVGVDLNTASGQLLSYVSGDRPEAGRIDPAATATPTGPSPSREALARRAAAGRQGVPAERRIPARPRRPAAAGQLGRASGELLPRRKDGQGRPACRRESLIGNTATLKRLDPRQFVDQRAGLPTIEDILRELEKPGRDPRQEFRVPQFAEGVHDLADLREGMILEGVVTNVTRFGAFVDIGVHQDGLIHISELDNRFIEDPTEVVAVGNIVRVKVLKIDAQRRRIALSRKQILP